MQWAWCVHLQKQAEGVKTRNLATSRGQHELSGSTRAQPAVRVSAAWGDETGGGRTGSQLQQEGKCI